MQKAISRFLSINLVLFLLINTQSFAQKNFKLELISTNKSEQAIISKLKTPNLFPTEIRRKQASEQLLMQLSAEGYVLAQIDSSTTNQNKLTLFISLNEKYEWGKLSLGNLSPVVVADIGFDEQEFIGKDFNYHRLIQIEEKIIRHYENHGYPFAAIKLKEIQIEKNEISAAFDLQEGPQFQIDTIILQGFTDIHYKYIAQLLGIESGDLYNEEKIEHISKQLASMSFAQEGKPYQVEFSDDKASIRLNLVKRSTNMFDGIVGFQPKSGSDNSLMLTGNLRLKLINSFKRGETIDLNWRSPGGGSQNIEVGFAYPYLFNTPLGVDYKFKLFKQDTNFINIRNTPGILFLINALDYVKVSGDFFSSSTINPTLINGIPIDNSVLDMSSSLFLITANFNHLDYQFNPRKGWLVNISGGYGNKKIIRQHEIEASYYDSIPLKSGQFRLSAHLEYFIPLFKRQTIRLASKSELLQGDYLLSNELFRIGGFSDLRGFDEQSIYASAYSMLTIEWRMLLERNSYLNVFWNGAYTENKVGNKTIYDQPMGFGAGLSFETKAGIFALSYALGQQMGNPLEFSAAKIHFGYMARF